MAWRENTTTNHLGVKVPGMCLKNFGEASKGT